MAGKLTCCDNFNSLHLLEIKFPEHIIYRINFIVDKNYLKFKTVFKIYSFPFWYNCMNTKYVTVLPNWFCWCTWQEMQMSLFCKEENWSCVNVFHTFSFIGLPQIFDSCPDDWISVCNTLIICWPFTYIMIDSCLMIWHRVFDTSVIVYLYDHKYLIPFLVIWQVNYLLTFNLYDHKRFIFVLMIWHSLLNTATISWPLTSISALSTFYFLWYQHLHIAGVFVVSIIWRKNQVNKWYAHIYWNHVLEYLI